MTELLQGLLQASTWLAVAVAVLLLAALRRLGGAALVYRSWWLLPLVMLAPMLPVAPPALTDSTAVLVLGTALRAPPVPGDARLWPLLLVGLWVAGVLVGAVVQWRAQRRFEHGMGPLRERADGNWQASADPGLPALVGL